MSIYNRWGDLVYTSDDVHLGWDGKSQTSGEIMPSGFYVYKIMLQDYNNKTWVYSGEINLIK